MPDTVERNHTACFGAVLLEDSFSIGVDTLKNSQKPTREREGEVTFLEDIEFQMTDDPEKFPPSIVFVEMNVRYKADGFIEEDVNCDSEFMLKSIREVGQAIRVAFYWLKRKEKCYLYMDNAGGHGTQEAIEKYTKILLDEFNI